MLSREKMIAKKSCVYHDKKSGVEFATVDRGQWYNQSLLMYILQKHKVVFKR